MHDGYGADWVDARCHLCDYRTDSVRGLADHLDEEHNEDLYDYEYEYEDAR